MRLKVWRKGDNEPKAHWQAKERFAREATPEMKESIAQLKALKWGINQYEWKKGKPPRFFVERDSGIHDDPDKPAIALITETMILFWHPKKGCFFVEDRLVVYSSFGQKKGWRRRLYQSRGKAKPFRV